MAKFLTGESLENAICDIIWNAEVTLMILSPYIRLDDYFKRLLDNHVNNPKLHFIIIFGKNETQVRKSLSQADFEYFKTFPNISIIYAPTLHAKYYGNEKKGVITSINMYDYSFKNNIEFGVYSEVGILTRFTNSADIDAWNMCWQIADTNQAVFIKRPVYEKKILSSVFGKNYIKSDILHDVTDNLYGLTTRKNPKNERRLNEFPTEIELGKQYGEMPSRKDVESPKIGYCIRKGVEIPFNPKRPFSEEAYRSWQLYSNIDYPEKYCHKTGKPSFGKTSMRNPILKDS